LNILYIHQYFKTPNEPGGTRSYWLSLELIKSGHNVTMLSANNNIETLYKRTNIDGIDVIYVKVPYSNNMGLIRRLFSFLQFMIVSCFFALFQKKITMVIATSTPLSVGFPALILKIFKGIPYLFEVRDLWPEVPIQMGAIKNKFIQKGAILFERIIYKYAKHIVALSPGMAEGILKYVPLSKVIMIPNMAKNDKFFPRENNTTIKQKLALNEDTLKIIYFGALGRANAIEYIIEAASILMKKNVKDIEFIFIGGGYQKELIIQSSKTLNNIKYLGEFDMEITSEIVNICDISIVTFNNIEILKTNSPNKLFDSLSAGKPIIVNSSGWTKKLVEENNCGFYVDPIKPVELAEKLISLKDNKAILSTMGINARKLAEQKYDKSILCKDFCTVVNTHFN